MSLHTDQVASVIQRAVQDVLARGLNDPRIRGLVSVTRVEVAPDLARADVFVSIMPEKYTSSTMHGLSHATGHVRRAVGNAVRMRRVPELAFRLDESLKKQAGVLAAISRALARDEKTRPNRQDQPGSEDRNP